MRSQSTEGARSAFADLLSSQAALPRVQVYTGPGASHSWIWLAQALEGLGCLGVRFCDHQDLLVAERPDVLVISGGDAFRMAEALGGAGLRRISEFVEGGGTYLGICAGAYLGLASGTSPLPSLRFCRSPITNFSENGAPLPIDARKYAVRCGERDVFQPLRGPMRIEVAGQIVVAPLFGGPCWRGPGDAEGIGRYLGWEDGARVLVPEPWAREVTRNKVAVLQKTIGKGRAVLLGPHFEHPDHPAAHAILAAFVLEARRSKFIPEAYQTSNRDVIGVRRALSEARVAYRGLEGAQWRIGNKVWEHERIGYFINAMWERVDSLDGQGNAFVPPEGAEDELRSMVRMVRAVRRGLHLEQDTTSELEQLVEALSSVSASYFNSYFEWRLASSKKAVRWA